VTPAVRTCHPHRIRDGANDQHDSYQKIDGLPSDLVRPHQSGQGKVLGFADCGVLKMARGQSAFKQSDVTRALRAASAAGQPIHRFEQAGWSCCASLCRKAVAVAVFVNPASTNTFEATMRDVESASRAM
jgi:hypothetical protein